MVNRLIGILSQIRPVVRRFAAALLLLELIFAANFQYVIAPHWLTLTAETSAATTPSSVKSKPGCEVVNSTVFASCPSLFIDFSKQADGPLNSPFISIYSGAPVSNGEAQYYTASPQNIRIENGGLVFQAVPGNTEGYRYTSARIETKDKFDVQYGKVVVRALLPPGTGTWPAIWMMPSEGKYASLSPETDFNRYLNDGEIDIAEAVGHEPNNVYGIAHSLAYPPDGPNRNYYNRVHVPDNYSVYHDYGLEWTPTRLTFTLDGKPFFTMNKKPGADYRSWPYDQKFYLIINLALGGTWGGVDRKDFPQDGINPAALPATMKVQSIKYFPYRGQ